MLSSISDRDLNFAVSKFWCVHQFLNSYHFNSNDIWYIILSCKSKALIVPDHIVKD